MNTSEQEYLLSIADQPLRTRPMTYEEALMLERQNDPKWWAQVDEYAKMEIRELNLRLLSACANLDLRTATMIDDARVLKRKQAP